MGEKLNHSNLIDTNCYFIKPWWESIIWPKSNSKLEFGQLDDV